MTCDIRLGRIVGLPAVWNGQLVGHVERPVLDREGRKLRGLIIRKGMGGARWADHAAISVLGDVSVILHARPVRVPRDVEEPPHAVQDESGLMLGRITDRWLHPEALTVSALEITLGIAEDLCRGRRVIRQWAIRPGDDGPHVLIPRSAWEVKE